MTDDQSTKYASYRKIAWVLYTVAAIVVIAILVLVVAEDNEEKLFYSLMTAAACYVFRPTEKFVAKYIARFTGVQKPAIND